MSGFDAYAAAEKAVKDIENIVNARIDDATTTAESARAIAISTINDLKGTKFTVPEDPPAPPKVDTKLNITYNLGGIRQGTFGTVQGTDLPDTVDMDSVPTVSPVTIPAFEPSVKSLNIPTAPDLNLPPDLDTFHPDDLPAIPVESPYADPLLTGLVPINVPAFSFAGISAFTDTAPVFEGSSLPGTFSWHEPTFHTEVLDEAVTIIQRMYAGNTGLPPAIEQAIFERTNDREDQLVSRAVSEVVTEWSERGFQSPQGMLNARVDQIRQDALLKKQGANRELAIKITDVQVENLRFAVTQALAAEQILVNIQLNSASRMFEAAKYQTEALIAVYNAQVSLFNARQLAYQTAATVYKARLEAELAPLEVYKAQIQGELAKSQVNESIVKAFVAQWEGVRARVEVYKAKLQGVQQKVEISKSKVDSYKALVEAYAARISAEKVKFEAYSAQVGGEAAKATIVDAQARAYAAQIQGIATGVTAQKTSADAAIASNELKLREFLARVERDKLAMQFSLDGIRAAVEEYNADTQRFLASAEVEKTKATLQISTTELQSKTAISLYSAVSAAYNARMEQLIREASLTVEGLKSAGQIATTLAASAYAAVHVGATLAGGGSLGASGSVSDSYAKSDSTSTNYNYNYEGT